MGFTPSAGDELQSEYLVAARARRRRDRGACAPSPAPIRPVLQVCEIRTIAADRLWMSPQYGRTPSRIHFTWAPDPSARSSASLADLEAGARAVRRRARTGARCSWHAPRYERLPDFVRLAERLDPRGAFRNAWLERHVLGAAR